jgi:hypothetical protein
MTIAGTSGRRRRPLIWRRRIARHSSGDIGRLSIPDGERTRIPERAGCRPPAREESAPKALSERFHLRAEEARKAAKHASGAAGRVLLEAAARWEQMARQWEAWEALGGEASNAP